MHARSLYLPLSAALLLTVSGTAAADVVTQWNEAALTAIKNDKISPPQASRALCMLHVAIYDAVNGIAPTHEPFLVSAPPASAASPEAAAAQAGYRMLSHLFPQERSAFERLLAEQLAMLTEGPAKRAGVKYGDFVAQEIIAARQDDGSSQVKRYVSETLPGRWRPTLPDFKSALLPQWGQVKPFALESGSQFRPANPPELMSEEYAKDVREVQRIGSAVSSARTLDQTHVALFWADGSGTVTPPGHWNRIARELAETRSQSLGENARLFALLNVALADAAIACWDMKYTCNLWRPVTAIQEAHLDDNPGTQRDPLWRPLLATPPFPTCTSGHSTFSGAAAEMLASFYGTDAVPFSSTSEEVSGSRSFQRLSQAAEEAGRSRVYGGIHFEFDNQSGLAAGREISKFIFANFMKPARGRIAAKPSQERIAAKPKPGRIAAENPAPIDDSGWLPVRDLEDTRPAATLATTVPAYQSEGAYGVAGNAAVQPYMAAPNVDSQTYGPSAEIYGGISVLYPSTAMYFSQPATTTTLPDAFPWQDALPAPECGCPH
jgi:hypothetical protein